MKRFIVIILVIVALCVAWSLYLDYRTNTFIETLPKASTEKMQSADQTQPAFTTTDENQEIVQTDPYLLNETTVEAEPLSKDPQTETSAEAQRLDTQADDNWRADDKPVAQTRKPDPWGEKNNSIHFSEMSADKRADHLRDSWIRMFGDIPEVHTASDYLRKTMKKERLTIDEVIAGLEASHYLFPKSGFNIRLEHYKSMKEMGIPLLYPDNVE